MTRSLLARIALLVCVLVVGTPRITYSQGNDGGEVIAAPTTLRYSIHLPANWQFRSKAGDSILTDYLVFADSSALLERSLQSLNGEDVEGISTGIGGWAAMLNQAFWRINAPTPSEQISAFLQAGTVAAEVVDQQQILLGGMYPGAAVLAIDRAADTEGYVGAVQVGEQDVLAFVIGVGPSRDFANSDSLLQAILQTIQAPAESGAQTSTVVVPAFRPSDQQAATPQPLAATSEAAGTNGDLIAYTMEQDVASIALPENWIVYDFLADENVFSYGDTDAAALSRFATVRPDMVSDAPELMGLGGLVVLYDPADAGVNAAAPDLAPVLDSVTQRLVAQGYEIVKPGSDFTIGGYPGRLAIVRGGEYGYIALVLFDSKLAFITATGMPDNFEANNALLNAILESVRVPAATANQLSETPASQSGIGGLLDSGTPVPSTPTPLPGIGGLGG